MKKMFVGILVFAILAGILIAADDDQQQQGTGSGLSGFSGLSAGLSQFCGSVKSLLPVAAMLMVVLAGVIYAGGQIMGAETRARANVWATACLTGALIAILIVVVAPPVLNAIYSGAYSC